MTEPIILVCGRIDGPLMLPDNLTGKCDLCGHPVQYRPHAPPKSIKRCGPCAAEMFQPGEDTVETTPRMIEDYLTYLRKQKQ